MTPSQKILYYDPTRTFCQPSLHRLEPRRNCRGGVYSGCGAGNAAVQKPQAT